MSNMCIQCGWNVPKLINGICQGCLEENQFDRKTELQPGDIVYIDGVKYSMIGKPFRDYDMKAGEFYLKLKVVN